MKTILTIITATLLLRRFEYLPWIFVKFGLIQHTIFFGQVNPTVDGVGRAGCFDTA